MSRYKLEVMLSAELLARLDAARKFEPRASFARRALEAALATDGGGGSPGVSKPVVPVPPRAPEREAPAEVPLPRIAKRKW